MKAMQVAYKWLLVVTVAQNIFAGLLYFFSSAMHEYFSASPIWALCFPAVLLLIIVLKKQIEEESRGLLVLAIFSLLTLIVNFIDLQF